MDNVYNGIDVSRWQGTIDWAKVKAAGIQFAFVRIGYCSNAGAVTKDTQFDANMAGANATGVDAGVYLYNYATSAEAAALAAQQVLELVKGYTLTYPVALDIEDSTNAALTKAQNTAIAKAFLSAIAAGGYCPLLYTNKSFAETELDMSELADYDFWLAQIASQPTYTVDYTAWQYSWSGSVNGISGDVDLDLSYKDYPTYIKENGLNGLEASGSDDGADSGADGGSNDAGTGSDDGGDSGEAGGDPGAQTPCEPDDISYAVVKNDTLYHIAQRHGIPLRILMHANPQIKNPDLIHVGDIVHIPQEPKADA